MASGTSYLTIVNRVLVRLREPEVTLVDENAYSELVSTMVNLVKNEIEGAWQWYDLRNSWRVTTTAGTAGYYLTGCTEKAMPLDAWNLTDKFEMKRVQWREMNKNFFQYGLDAIPQGVPSDYCPNGTNIDTGAYKLDVWPVPDAAYTLQFNMYCPTVNLSAEADLYYGPLEPMIEGVLAYAFKERGEDGGMSSKEQFEIYRSMLALAVSREQGTSEDDTTWTTGC